MSRSFVFAGLTAAGLMLSACGQAERAPANDPVAAPSTVVAADPRPSPAASPATASPETATPVRPAATAARPVGTRPLVITAARVEAEKSPELERCLDSGQAAEGVTTAMAACITAELQAQDARLNAAYGQAMAGLDDAGKTRLRAEERAWIRERDAGCNASATGGTIDRIGIPGCLLDETIRRRLSLESMADKAG